METERPISRATPEEIEQYKAAKGEPVPKPVHVGTFVKDKATAERMLAGARRHLNGLGLTQIELRVKAIRLSPNELRGAIRRAKREQRRKAFKGSEGFAASARATRTSSGPSAKAVARQRAREFNATYGGNNGTQDTTEQAGTDG